MVLACIIFSSVRLTPPVVDPDAAAVTMVWSYIGELIFNMLVLVGSSKDVRPGGTGNDGIVKGRTKASLKFILQCCCCCYPHIPLRIMNRI